MRHEKRLNQSKVLICLLAYFLGWMESAHALPLLFVVLDDSHRAIVTENQGKFHLTVHHLGNGDKHEHANRGIAIITSDSNKQSDHEIGVSGGEQLISPATKIINLVKEYTPLTSVRPAPVDVSSPLFIPNSFSPTNLFSAVLTTVLLI